MYSTLSSIEPKNFGCHFYVRGFCSIDILHNIMASFPSCNARLFKTAVFFRSLFFCCHFFFLLLLKSVILKQSFRTSRKKNRQYFATFIYPSDWQIWLNALSFLFFSFSSEMCLYFSLTCFHVIKNSIC